MGKEAMVADPAKVLILYYSWGGNTRVIDDMIHEETGADLVEISPVKAYPSDLQACVDLVKGAV